jgi:pantetheine-phosphate adenylyltransferase
LRVALYPGRFDPVTNGHLDIISRAAALFDRVIVAPASTTSTLFTTEERTELLETAIAHLPNVEVKPFSGLMVEFARAQGATIVVRGIRAVTDFYAEFDMALMNKKMAPEIESVYLMTALGHLFISASRIREVAALGYEVGELVPPHVAESLRRKLGAAQAGAALGGLGQRGGGLATEE